MKFYIERPFLEALVARFPDLQYLAGQLKFGKRAELAITQLQVEQLLYLSELYQNASGEAMGQASQIATLAAALAQPEKKFKAGDLEQILPEFTEYVTRDAIKGWLYKANLAGKPLPYLITRIDFTPAGEEETGRITVELKANSLAKMTTVTLTVYERDIENKSIPEILADKGYLKETEALMAAYQSSTDKYFEWRAQYGKQFVGKGTGVYAEDPLSTHRNQDWARKSLVVLSSNGGWAKLINDEDVLQNRELTLSATGNILAKYLRKAGKSMNYNSKVEREVEQAQEEMPKGMFTEIPVHGYVLMFHLDLHHHLWVHVDDMAVYQYQPHLKDKLILPPEQTDLIDILTAEMDMLMDDIVEGKSGGTTVLCAGPPGVGKTLTAEVYSEIIQRPLYRVHSGQLGLSVAEMEKALKDTLTRAQRWGAVMLIDEADVYIKRRDDNIAANAVVGVFLRVLEYFNGLLFLTTNRVNDIDEAIISRCIALVRFFPPELEDRCRIWGVMAEQFNLQLSDELIQQLAQLFPEACGRDIKGLSKLVAKFCQHKKVPPTLDVFEKCSVFRGLDYTHHE